MRSRFGEKQALDQLQVISQIRGLHLIGGCPLRPEQTDILQAENVVIHILISSLFKMNLVEKLRPQCECTPHCQCISGIDDLRKIWAEDQFKSVMGAHFLSNEQIYFLHNHLIRTISLLKYTDFPMMDELIMRWVRNGDRFDEQLLDVTRNRPDWLADQTKYNHFMAFLGLFTGPVLKEGADRSLKLGQRMPFQGMPSVEGVGLNGEVSSRFIAKGHLILNKRVSLADAVLKGKNKLT